MTLSEEKVEKPLDPASNGCANWDNHELKEVYYGHECGKCGLFFAYGCAPWDDCGNDLVGECHDDMPCASDGEQP